MKTAEELNALKEEVKALNKKLRELSEEELALVTGGVCGGDSPFVNENDRNDTIFEHHIYDNKVERDFDKPRWE